MNVRFRAVLPSWIPVYAGIQGEAIRAGIADPDEVAAELRALAQRSAMVYIVKADGTQRHVPHEKIEGTYKFPRPNT